MKPVAFSYMDPVGLAECLDLLARHGDEARILAGGQSLMPMLNMRLARPTQLVDINRVSELRAYTAGSGGLAIGALVRMAQLERDTEIARRCPPLAEVLPLIGHAAIRTRGTICGSMAHADPSAEIPAMALLMDAEVRLLRRGAERKLSAAEFLRGPMITAIEPGELLAELRLPAWHLGDGWGVAELWRRHGDFAVTGALARLGLENGRLARVAVVVFGVGGVPVRLSEVEAHLTGRVPGWSMAAEAGEMAATTVEPTADLHGSAWYRRRLAAEMVARALTQAIGRAGVTA